MRFRPYDAVGLRSVRPGWLTAGLAKLAVLSVFIVLVGMFRPHLSRTSAAVSVAVAAALIVVAAAWFFGATRRLVRALPFVEAGERVTDAVLGELRRIGLPLLALGFFLAWTFVYIALWAVHPGDAFRGLGDHPRFADFFYYAVSTAFLSPPGDLIARSRGVRSATMIEMLTAFALLTTYASSFIDWGHEREEAE
jgi:hypothetical protein